MSQLTALMLLACLFGSAFALYDSHSKVIKLNNTNFKSLVLDSKDIWLIEFYAPWCGHCKSLAPEWEKTAKALEGIAKVGAVDMTTDKEAGSPYDIKGFPTLKFFGDNKQNPQDYSGERTAKDLTNFMIEEMKKITQSRLGGQSKSSKKTNHTHEHKQEKAETIESEPEGDGDVVVLTEANFDSLVLNSQDSWFIDFYAPWCAHCKSLAPEWSKVATELKNEKIKVAKVDVTVHASFSQRFLVTGFPSLRFFPAGSKKDSEAIEFKGGRDATTLISWAIEQRDSKKPIMFSQLTSQSVYEEYCSDSNGVCIIFFLPHLYDSSVEQRNGYISLIKEVAESNKKHPFNYLWSQGGDQFDFEEKLNASGSGYPSAVAISNKKQVFTTFKGSFKHKDLDKFVSRILSGHVNFSPLPHHLPRIIHVAHWKADHTEKAREEPKDMIMEQEREVLEVKGEL